MNRASARLYLSQPSLSVSIKELEDELGFGIFLRSNKGVSLTPQGEEFLRYARQVVEQYQMIEDKYLDGAPTKKKFDVSMQHYTFAVQAFIAVARRYNMDEYEFAVHETTTADVIENVANLKSEVGVLYTSSFNARALGKLFDSRELEFVPLFDCGIFVFIHKSHPLAGRDVLTLEELKDYPCLAFEQGDRDSFYMAEEMFSTYKYRQIIRANDRATMLNLTKGLMGYTICSATMERQLNGDEFIAIPLDTEETIELGYVHKLRMPLSHLAVEYIEELKKFKV